MASTISDYLYQKQLDFLLKGTVWTPPTTIYVALFITAPSLDGINGVEVSGSGYTRIPIAQGAGEWLGPDASSLLEYSNINSIDFDTPSGDWGTITASGLYDSVSGSTNLLYIAILTTPNTVSNGDSAPKILANQLRITRTG